MSKNLRSLISVLLTALILASVSVPAFADEAPQLGLTTDSGEDYVDESHIETAPELSETYAPAPPANAGSYYIHNPMDNPKAAADIIVNPQAVYGYSPNPDSARLFWQACSPSACPLRRTKAALL